MVEEDGAPIAALSVANYIRTVRLNTTGRRLLWKLTWSDGRESDSWLEEVPWDVRPHDTFVLPEATNNSGFGDMVTSNRRTRRHPFVLREVVEVSAKQPEGPP